MARTDPNRPFTTLIWEELPMSEQGYRNWPAASRGKIRRIVLKHVATVRLRRDHLDSYLGSVKKVKQFIIDEVGRPGTFVLRGMSHGKTKTRRKQVRLAKIIVTEANEQLYATVSDHWRLSRYTKLLNWSKEQE